MASKADSDRFTPAFLVKGYPMTQAYADTNGSGALTDLRPPFGDEAFGIANAVAKALKGDPAGMAKGLGDADAPSWAFFARALGQLVDCSPNLRAEIETLAAKGASRHLVEQNAEVPSQEAFLEWLRAPGAGAKGGTVARAFWWGFHVEISHEDLVAFLAGAGSVNSIVAAIGGSIPSPAQPWIVLVAGFISVSLAALRGLDRGRGVYISMSWFAPGVFIPTSV